MVTFDKSKLFLQRWMRKDATAWLFLTHGQAEHSGCYERFVAGMTDAKVNVLGWDLRGHGRSEGRRGYAQEFMDYVRDYALVLEHCKKELFVDLPWFATGHSMGALITLRYLSDQLDENCKGVLLSSPFLGIKIPVPTWKSGAAQILNLVAPQLTLPNGLDYHHLTSDKSLFAEYENDPLRHDKISSGVFLGLDSAFRYCLDLAPRAKWPLLLQYSAHDKVVTAEKSKELFELWGGKKEIFTYENSEHEIYNDIEREQVFEKCRSFLDRER